MKTALKSAACLAAWIACSISVSGAALAQPEDAALDASPALWSVSDADSTVYLFGAIHALPPELRWRSPAVEAALADSEILYLGADVMSGAAQETMTRLIQQRGLNPPGITLSALISDKAKAHMAAIATRLGMPADQLGAELDRLKPWLAGVTLGAMQMQADGRYDAASGVDAALAAGAQALGLELAFIETLEAQLGLLAGQPIDIQIAEFEASLARMVVYPDMNSALVRIWAAGDMSALYRDLNEVMRADMPATYDAVIVGRTQTFIPLIEAALGTDRNAFFSIGAGHMPGEEGVIALLEANGLRVTRR